MFKCVVLVSFFFSFFSSSAVWYDPTSYPTSWQLDPTEGPNRERRRLQRCYLTIPNKYLLKDRRKPEGGGEKKKTLFGKILCRTGASVSQISYLLLFSFLFFFLIETVKPPLSFLFEDKTHSSFSSTVKDKATSESIRYNILLLSSCNPLSEHVMSGCKKNVILLSIGSPDVASALPLPEKQQGSYFWVRHRPLFTRSSIICSL